MSLLNRVKKRVGAPIVDLAGRLGIDIQKVQVVDRQIRKLRYITDTEIKLHVAEELVRKYPMYPMLHLELVQCLHRLSDLRQFEHLDKYAEVRRDWLIRTGLDKLDMEFIWPGMVVGSLGNHYAIENLLKANLYGLRSDRKPFLLLPQNAQLRNQAFFEYFEPHIHVVRDGEAINALKMLEFYLTLPLGICLPMNDGCPFLDIAANRIEMEREKQGLKSALFQLSDRHQEMGLDALKKLGLPRNAWYVTLHVREPGYRGETRENTKESWRNANPLDYLKAVEAITKKGGWVFRMGDPSMTPMPLMPQVIDYALHEIRCDWMDVFLGATCRFLIGTGSGYYHIPALFGVPCMLTNFPGFVPYYGMRSQDLYLPRWLKKIKSEKLVTFEEFMSPPVSMFWLMKRYKDAGLQWVENSPEVLELATIEMIDRTVNGTFSQQEEDDDLQKHFKVIAEACGLKYGGKPVKAFASISGDFLERHADLL
ncbi:MAG: TIGR04372 family glycosyltransferase [Deltaproteobacteria bacterium]|nr:TIGR04372 family glycosyltransferase [Deltaproteobacteria bacterium]